MPSSTDLRDSKIGQGFYGELPDGVGDAKCKKRVCKGVFRRDLPVIEQQNDDTKIRPAEIEGGVGCPGEQKNQKKQRICFSG
jgi:hypothetical protein